MKNDPNMKNDAKKQQTEQLDRELEDSFPASDPPSMTQPKTKSGAPKKRETPEDELKRRARQERDTGSRQKGA